MKQIIETSAPTGARKCIFPRDGYEGQQGSYTSENIHFLYDCHSEKRQAIAKPADTWEKQSYMLLRHRLIRTLNLPPNNLSSSTLTPFNLTLITFILSPLTQPLYPVTSQL